MIPTAFLSPHYIWLNSGLYWSDFVLFRWALTVRRECWDCWLKPMEDCRMTWGYCLDSSAVCVCVCGGGAVLCSPPDLAGLERTVHTGGHSTCLTNSTSWRRTGRSLQLNFAILWLFRCLFLLCFLNVSAVISYNRQLLNIRSAVSYQFCLQLRLICPGFFL